MGSGASGTSHGGGARHTLRCSAAATCLARSQLPSRANTAVKSSVWAMHTRPSAVCMAGNACGALDSACWNGSNIKEDQE